MGQFLVQFILLGGSILSAIQHLVKAIALHGLGLCVYAGEDLPQVENESGLRAVPATFGKVHESLEHRQNNVPSTELLTAHQLRYIKKLIADTQANEPQLLSFLGFYNLESIPKCEVNRVIRSLESYKQIAA